MMVHCKRLHTHSARRPTNRMLPVAGALTPAHGAHILRSRCMPPVKQRARSLVTIDNVAAAAGVSIATVSRVLNQTTPVAAETMERVLAAVEQLGYVPQTAARHLARGKTKTLGLLLPDVSNDFFSPLLGSITES